MTNGDLIWVHQITICRTVEHISRCIAHQKLCLMTFPSNLLTLKQDFFKLFFFSVMGVVDDTHIPIVSPKGDSAKVYFDRKVFFYKYAIQEIYNANPYFTNVTQ